MPDDKQELLRKVVEKYCNNPSTLEQQLADYLMDHGYLKRADADKSAKEILHMVGLGPRRFVTRPT